MSFFIQKWSRINPFAGKKATESSYENPQETSLELVPIPSESGTSNLSEAAEPNKLGMFNGVFCPTILTLLGTMIYLREGWVVGNAGLGGAILIILLSFGITGTTAVAMSSITTNIHVGAGGVFSIISQSLGLAVGGSIGIAYYLAHALSTALYVYGFVEGWLYIFPTHSPLFVAIIVFCIIFALSYINMELVMHIQIIILVIVVASLVVIFAGLPTPLNWSQIEFWGEMETVPFWVLFAILFPSATDITVGSSLSGSLKNPRSAIPVGTLLAWGISLVVYIMLAFWYALAATPEELRNNLMISVDRSFWGPAVLLGIIMSSFAAAVAAFTAASPVLQALGQNKIVPYASFFEKVKGQIPRNAMIFTAGIVLITIVFGSLNSIAELLAMFFLLTYFMINAVLFIEQQLSLISFRPTFRVARFFPLCGGLACLFTIIIISPFIGLVSVLLSISFYFYLDRRGLESSTETVHSGLFFGLANWAAKKVMDASSSYTRRSWRPEILILIERRTQFDGNFMLLRDMVSPQGSLYIVGLMHNQDVMPLVGLKHSIREMQNYGIFVSSVIVNSENYVVNLSRSVDYMKGALFHPNIIFTDIHERTTEELCWVIEEAETNTMGVLFFAEHPEVKLGRFRNINLWIRDQSPDWLLEYSLANLDLTLLLSLKLMQNWKANLRIFTILENKENIDSARKAIQDFLSAARFPHQIQIIVECDTNFMNYMERNAPRADLNIFGMPETVIKEYLEHMVLMTRSSCFFIRDSGVESVLA